MRKAVAGGLLAGVAIGAVGVFWLGQGGPTGGPAATGRIMDPPPVSAEEATRLRGNRFADVTTVSDTLRLPSPFDRAEALHVLAGRSDAAAVQELIHEAARISRQEDRKSALTVLFSRLADVDPRSAAAILEQDPFSGNAALQTVVWQAWARRDVDGAVQAARQLPLASQKRRAAHLIHRAMGLSDATTTAAITAALGTEPDGGAISAHLKILAATSMNEALDFANGLEKPQLQLRAFQALGADTGERAPASIDRIAVMIPDPRMRRIFEQSAIQAFAREHPVEFLASAYASGAGATRDHGFSIAVQRLAQRDLAEAERQLAAIAAGSQRYRQLAHAIATRMAEDDPRAAVDWAQEHDPDGSHHLVMRMIHTVTRNDPELALALASEFKDSAMHAHLFNNVLHQVAKDMPERALAMLNEMPASLQRTEAKRSLIQGLANDDPIKALNWIIENPETFDKDLMQFPASMAMRRDPRSLIPLLESVDGQTAAQWQTQIAGAIARSESAASARAFIALYEGQPVYSQLQAAVVAGVANRDIREARTLLDTLPPGQDRDQALMSIASIKARVAPREALEWIKTVADHDSRLLATNQIVSSWAGSDPEGALRWVRTLPGGVERDGASVAILMRYAGSADFPDDLIEGITDPLMKQQAQVAKVYAVARENPDRALELLNTLDVDPTMRRQIEQVLRARSRTGFGAHIF